MKDALVGRYADAHYPANGSSFIFTVQAMMYYSYDPALQKK